MKGFSDEGDIPRRDLISLNKVPEALYTCTATELWQHLNGPTLLHLSGKEDAPLFLTILLHGNEHTGFEALKLILNRYRDKQFPRPLIIFIGNIAAAKANTRTLSNQIDFNRCWPGTPHKASKEAAIMAKVTSYVKSQRPFASVDIHNNTGKNPHYGCINRLEPAYIHLAKLFARDIVYFERPLGVQSAALAPICPAVTIECGRIGESAINEETAAYIDRLLNLKELPTNLPSPDEYTLLQTISIIKLPEDASFSFNGTAADFILRPDLDELNFQKLSPGASLGVRCSKSQKQLEILSAIQDQPPQDIIEYQDNEVRLKQTAIPAMLTLDTNAIRSDCLGYLMQEINERGAPLK
jgi:hypothetical protein